MSDQTDALTHFLERPRTIQNIRRDFQEWHLGRTCYAVWAIDVDYPAVRQQVAAAKQHLAEFLHDEYFRKPHITLSICGFLSDKPKLIDDFGVSNFEAHLSALNQLKLKPFEIEIDLLASFASAPFFHVHDPSNSILKLRNCLALSTQDYQDENYIPHVTVGLYSGTWSTEAVKIRLDAFLKDNVTRCLINRISLMRYNASEIGGALTTIADYHFDQAEIEWHEKPPFSLETM